MKPARSETGIGRVMQVGLAFCGGRMLHHGLIAKYGPRNRRTKIDFPPEQVAGEQFR
jgi:hypothetical protein